MKIKPCQLNVRCPCADKGFVCLKTDEDKRRFNEKLCKMQKDLEKAKFDLPDKKEG